MSGDSALDAAGRLIELALLGLVLWRVLSQGDPAAEDAPTPHWATAMEKRIAHLQNAVFHMNRRLDSTLKNAATEPAMRVGPGLRPFDRAPHAPRATPRDTPSAKRGDSQPRGALGAPTPFVGTPRPFGAFKDTERMSGEELEKAIREAAEADSGPLAEGEGGEGGRGEPLPPGHRR